ncbi:MAG TPA: aminotransferase class V-fold PLP-dependent enzyme, partial [Candidatus Methylomirabilis sp.]|nr:aminotransferase class V-fold PLP-dependent enzyme [Candidatus Methylomirabilis sp.]
MRRPGFSSRGKAALQAPEACLTVNLLPGPVKIHPSVRATFARRSVSHRSRDFVHDFQEIRQRLCKLVNASHVVVLLGSGTLANDAVAAQLSVARERGLILRNGEFGERLVEQARRFGLSFRVLTARWGCGLPYATVRRSLGEDRSIRWLWAVHCETSTGVLNDLPRLKELAREADIRLCLDCISSIGTVPVNLAGVHLATGVSGKGLASYPGLSFVFHQHPIGASAVLPRYLDLGAYAESRGVPFTTSSNLVYALGQSLTRFGSSDGKGPSSPAAVYQAKAVLARWLRPRLEALGLTILAPEAIASPAVMTL